MPNDTSLLLVTHVAVRQGPGGPLIDDQTAAGIRQWSRYFDSVSYYGVADRTNDAGSTTTWVNASPGALGANTRVFALPSGYSVTGMAKHYKGVRATLRDAVSKHRHLCFTIGGLVGDWPALAAIESIDQKREYVAWIDRVEPPIIRNKTVEASFPKKVLAEIAIPIMEMYTKHILRHSSVALLQGLDTFNHYSRYASRPHVTYDTHTHVSDQISPAALAAKRERLQSGAPLNIVYIGRAAAMKGPNDWLATLGELRDRGAKFHATWIGDGPELPAMRAQAERLHLTEAVTLAGFEGDRERLLQSLRDSDLLLFCHKTPESPRCLIEALVSGCPIVGYDTAYPRGLVQAHGGGVFSPQDDIASLSEALAVLDGDRISLADMVSNAARTGEAYNEDAVYCHRAELMRSRPSGISQA